MVLSILPIRNLLLQKKKQNKNKIQEENNKKEEDNKKYKGKKLKLAIMGDFHISYSFMPKIYNDILID